MRKLLLLFTASVCLGPAVVQSSDPLLFEADSMLELTMTVNLDALCRPSEDPDCDYVPSTFQYRDSSGEEQTVPISIRRRDGWRALHTNCQVPTLFVRFTAEDASGTPFENQTTLALTSHCGKGLVPDNVESPTLPDHFERYVINEYLGYRLYNLVTDASLKTRLVRMTYVDPDNARLSFTRDAFFSEHFAALAERLETRLLPQGSFNPAQLDQPAADQMALFQFMIGNTDWSIAQQENIILLEGVDGRQIPVLFDLDLSGLVNAHYATPAPGLPIKAVTQRYFMGECRENTDWEALFAKFEGLRSAILTELSGTPGLGRGDRRMTGVFLDEFFHIIGSVKAREQYIIEACQPADASLEAPATQSIETTMIPGPGAQSRPGFV